MRNKMRAIFIFGFLVLVLAACGRDEAAQEASYAYDQYGGEAAMEAPAAEFMDDTAFANDGTLVQTQLPAAQERLIIRTGRIDLVVEDTEATVKEIADLAGSYGGWVVDSSLSQSGANVYGNITVRIPAEQFESALTALRQMATDVTGESTSGQDVTDEYVDLESRLGNLEATAARVRAFLDDAADVEDALAVNQELSRLEGEIEVIKGRMQYLSQSSAFSTISVSLTPNAATRPLEVAGWQPQGVAKDAVEALAEALEFLANAGIWMVLFFLPVALLLLLPVYLLFVLARRLWRRRAARRAMLPAEAAD